MCQVILGLTGLLVWVEVSPGRPSPQLSSSPPPPSRWWLGREEASRVSGSLVSVSLPSEPPALQRRPLAPHAGSLSKQRSPWPGQMDRSCQYQMKWPIGAHVLRLDHIFTQPLHPPPGLLSIATASVWLPCPCWALCTSPLSGLLSLVSAALFWQPCGAHSTAWTPPPHVLACMPASPTTYAHLPEATQRPSPPPAEEIE